MGDSSDDSIDFENDVNNFGNSKQLTAYSSRDVFFDESNKLLLHSVSEICIYVAKKCDVKFSEGFIKVLSECLKEKLCAIIQMMEILAKHAGRSEIRLDDFKLYFRTSSKEVYSNEQTFGKDGLSINKLSKTMPLSNSSQHQNNATIKRNRNSFLEFLFEKMTLATCQEENKRSLRRRKIEKKRKNPETVLKTLKLQKETSKKNKIVNYCDDEDDDYDDDFV